MKIAITTPTGNIGSKLADILIEEDVKLFVLARKPEKVRHLAERGATILAGTLEDAGYVRESTKGMDAFFWITPPDAMAKDFRAHQNKLADIAALAIQTNRIVRVVNISSFGAHLDSSCGPINGLHDVENRFNQTGAYVTHYRPGYFFENFLMQLEPMRDAGSIFLPLSDGVSLPMIATADIARAASQRLLDDSWTGRPVLGLHGPCHLSFPEAAACIGKGLGKDIGFVRTEIEALRKTLLAMGLGESFVESIVEMHEGFESGHTRALEERTPETTTATTLEDFARQVIKPILTAAVAP